MKPVYEYVGKKKIRRYNIIGISVFAVMGTMMFLWNCIILALTIALSLTGTNLLDWTLWFTLFKAFVGGSCAISCFIIVQAQIKHRKKALLNGEKE